MTLRSVQLSWLCPPIRRDENSEVSMWMSSSGSGGVLHLSLCVREDIAMIKRTVPPHRTCFLSTYSLIWFQTSFLLNKGRFLMVTLLCWVLTSSAPGPCFCRPEVSPSHTQKFSCALAGGLSKAPAALANGPSFESLTLTSSVSHMKECLWSSS